MTKKLGVYQLISVQHVLEALLESLASVSKNRPLRSELDFYDTLVLAFDVQSKDDQGNPRLHLSKKEDYDELRDYVLEWWDDRTE